MDRFKHLAFIVVAVGVLILVGERSASALGSYLTSVNSCKVTCGTSATEIRCGGGHHSYQAVNESAVEVFVGDSSVTSSGADEGPKFCDDSACASGAVFGGDIAYEYCVVASGTQEIKVRTAKVGF